MEDRIVALIATSTLGLKRICSEEEGLPHYDTIRVHIQNNKEFSDRYARAKEEQADVLADEMIEIADNCTDDVALISVSKDGEAKEGVNHSAINRARLQIDTRKWIASKLKPKKYGDKVDVDHSGGLVINWNVKKTYAGTNAEPETNEGD